jgi:hypothetical protein
MVPPKPVPPSLLAGESLLELIIPTSILNISNRRANGKPFGGQFRRAEAENHFEAINFSYS